MNKTIRRLIRLVIILFFFIFLTISLSLYRSSTEKHARKILYYYNDVANRITGSSLALKSKASINLELENLVRIWLVAPKNIEWRPAFGAKANLDLLSVAKSTCYISLDLEDSVWQKQSSADLEQDVKLLSKTIRFNYPTIKTVKIFINGFEQL